MARIITIDPHGRQNVCQENLRAIRMHLPAVLSAQQLVITMMVADLTLGRGQRDVSLTYSQIAKGIWSRDGCPVHAGANLTSTAVERIVPGLCDRGVLKRKRSYLRQSRRSCLYNYSVGWTAVNASIKELIVSRNNWIEDRNNVYSPLSGPAY